MKDVFISFVLDRVSDGIRRRLYCGCCFVYFVITGAKYTPSNKQLYSSFEEGKSAGMLRFVFLLLTGSSGLFRIFNLTDRVGWAIILSGHPASK